MAMLRSQAGDIQCCLLLKTFDPECLLPSALLLNSSAKIRLGLKVYKTSQEATPNVPVAVLVACLF